MSSASWTMFRVPFGQDVVRWHVVAVDRANARVRLAPHLDPEALRERLDAEAGPAGWSLVLRPHADVGLVAELALGDVRRGVVVRASDAPGLGADDVTIDAGEAATGAAWTAACAAFGASLPVVVSDDGWVEADPVTLEPLRRPEHGPAVGESATLDRAATGSPHDTTEVVARDAAVARGAGDPAAAPDAKPEAHVVIDRLVERLRSEGLGADAARLVARHGGYGADATASRALYAELRALLLQRGAAS